jgi:hypothetical protein
MILHPWYITGLVEGEGCFSVSFTLRKRLKLGIETRPSFSISLNRRDLSLLKEIHAYFKCGSVRYSKSDRTYKYEVRSVKDLVEHIIPHFQKYKLNGDKLNDFEKFVQICKKVHANFHRSKKYLPDIINLAYTMNPAGKRKHEKNILLKMLDE